MKFKMILALFFRCSSCPSHIVLMWKFICLLLFFCVCVCGSVEPKLVLLPFAQSMWMHVKQRYEGFEIKLNWEENTKIVSRFYCVKIRLIPYNIISRYNRMCVYFYYSIYLFARARVCVCAAYWKRFSPTNNKNNRNIKASVILGFRASFPRTRTHCPIYRCKLDICFGCYSFYAIGAGEKFERRMCVRARFRTICTIVFAIISNWWFSRTISILRK